MKFIRLPKFDDHLDLPPRYPSLIIMTLILIFELCLRLYRRGVDLCDCGKFVSLQAFSDSGTNLDSLSKRMKFNVIELIKKNLR